MEGRQAIRVEHAPLSTAPQPWGRIPHRLIELLDAEMSHSPSTASVDSVAAGPPPRRTLVRDSLSRLVSDGSGLLLGTVSSIVTARILGPSSKGTLAALTFVTVLVIQGCLMGLGDAIVVQVGQGKASLQTAISSSVSALLLSSVLGALVVLLYSLAQLPLERPWVWEAVITACVTIGVASVAQFLIYVMYARHRIVTASALTILAATTTTVAVVIFCYVLGLDVFGGLLAGLVAALVGLLAAAIVLRRASLSLRLRLQRAYLRPALHFGLRTQLANVLAYSSARLDLLLVYALASFSQAGLYSVALTVGTLTGFIAIAVSYASFPRMAQMSDAGAMSLTAELARAAASVGIPFMAIASLLTWATIPSLLGSAYQGSVVPAVILLFGNVLWGEQWLLSRALAARGDPRVLFRSFATNLATMVLADLALIPLLAATGAAIGSVVAPAAGLAVCFRAYSKRGVRPRELLPRFRDIGRWGQLALQGYRARRAG